jgi:hypothetical protein
MTDEATVEQPWLRWLANLTKTEGGVECHHPERWGLTSLGEPGCLAVTHRDGWRKEAHRSQT